MIGDKLSATESSTLKFVIAHPGEIEQRADYEGNRYWYMEGGRANYHTAVALSTLLEVNLIEIRQEERRTVGMRVPRKARTVYAK